MILTHESGSQEDQFDEKKWRQKISWDYPFKEESDETKICVKSEPKPWRHELCAIWALWKWTWETYFSCSGF